MVENSLISIIIPVFNREKLIVRTLESVQNQTYTNWECLIVDDGSSDDTLNVIASFVDIDKRFQIISHRHVGNANILRNIGISKAKGEYIAMLDSDDEFMPNHLSRRLSKIKEWGCDGIYGSFLFNDGDVILERFSRDIKKNESMIDYLLTGGICQTSSYFYTKSSIDSILWDEELKRHQDYDLSIRFSAKYKFKSDILPTVKVNWIKNEKRNIDFYSVFLFYEKFKQSITPKIKINYLFSKYYLAVEYNNKLYKKKFLAELINNESILTKTQKLLVRYFPFFIYYYIKISRKS